MSTNVQSHTFEVTPDVRASGSDIAMIVVFIFAMLYSKSILDRLFVAFDKPPMPIEFYVLITNGTLYAFAFMALLKLIKVFRMTCSNRILITPHHIEYVQGIAAKRSTKLNITDIRTVDIDQTVAERVLGVGTIRIASASTDGYEIEAKAILHPERLRDYLKHRIGVLKYNETDDPSIRY